MLHLFESKDVFCHQQLMKVVWAHDCQHMYYVLHGKGPKASSAMDHLIDEIGMTCWKGT